MTAREKLGMEHPECVDEECCGGCVSCPDQYGYLPRPSLCDLFRCPSEESCSRCWDREIPEEVVEKFNTVGNAQPIFSDEFKEGERKQMYSLFLKEFANSGVRYKLIEENKDLTTISEKVKRLVISGTPIDDLRIVKNVEFEFKCALKFKEDE